MNKVMLLVAGWCPPTVVDEMQNELAIDTVFDWVDRAFPDAEVTLVSGLCDVGVMSYAYFASRFDWHLVGVACKKAADFDLFPVNEKQLVGENWGDESSTFTAYLTNHEGPKIFVNVAGGNQANREEEICRAAGATVFHFSLDRK